MLQCNDLKIDIDTGSTTTTRKWQIKITQYECGNLMAPQQDCLQYHTAASGIRTQISQLWELLAHELSIIKDFVYGRHLPYRSK